MRTAAATTSNTGHDTGQLTRAVPLVFALLLGAFIVGFVGMSPIAAVHNAGHDYRHSMGFPCH